jgi:outer membrane receptor for ferrienterochelin and colicins
MRILRSAFFGLFFAGFLFLVSPAAAQQGTLLGTVTDVDTGLPVEGMQIQVLGGSGSPGTLSNAQGNYRLELPPGVYGLGVIHVAYREDRFDRIRVSAGETTRFDIHVKSLALELSPLQITVNRSPVPQKQVEAPAAVYLVGATEISERVAPTPVDHLRNTPGVDIITHGIQATNVVIRGFNNIFSGSLHALTDHRLAGVPSLRVNLIHFIPSNNEDIDRMEVVLGPGSALYGPNTANGVLHILTKSPLDPASHGTTLSLSGGERSYMQGMFRSAFLITDDLGFKVSGQYMRGDEWEFVDPVEEPARLAAVTDPAGCQAELVALRGFDASTAATSCGRIGDRDFRTRRYGLEARADYRFMEDATAIFTYGRTSATGIELTGLGAGQTEDWVYQFYQARMNKGRFFAQGYLNTSDAGDTFLLRDGVPLVDKSRLFVAQIQHGLSLFDDRQDFTYGFDFFGTRPDTEGTINGSWEDEDEMNEWGVYAQSKTVLTPKLDLVLAARMDDHDMLPDKVFSPRAALVFKPTEDSSFRVTYNRAFSTPSSLNFFLDISGGFANEPLGSMGYSIRAFGTSKDGYGFQGSDGSLMMRSPFTPAVMGGPSQLIPTDVAYGTFMWPAAVGAMAAGAAADGSPLPPDLIALLSSLTPAPGAIGVEVWNPVSGQAQPLGSADVPDVPGVRESYTETYEVGWQGVLANRFRLSAALYHTTKNDFVSPLLLQTPMFRYDSDDVGTFIDSNLPAPLAMILTGAYMQPPFNLSLADAAAKAATDAAKIKGGIAAVPTGVVSSEEVAAQGPDMIVTYRNVGDVKLWGADLGFSWFMTDDWMLNGSYSHVSKDYFSIGTGIYTSLNAPKDKATLAVAYRNGLKGINAEARVRHTAEFPAESAGYVGTACITGGKTGGIFEEPCVEAATLFDVNFGYKIPSTLATVQFSVTNLFDEEYRSFVGVPYIGRFAMLGVKYDLF